MSSRTAVQAYLYHGHAGEGAVEGGNMYLSAASPIPLRGLSSTNKVANAPRECRRTPSVGYMGHGMALWVWGWLGTDDAQKACILDLPIE